MKKRILAILITFISLFIILPIGAYSLFIFSSFPIKKDENITLGGIDNIKENYDSSVNQDYTSKEYTIYFFPSTLYSQQYYNYLNETNTITNNSEILPEDMFGYIDVTYSLNQGDYDINIDNVVTPSNIHDSFKVNNATRNNGDEYYLDYVGNQKGHIYSDRNTYLQADYGNDEPSSIDAYYQTWEKYRSDSGSPKWLNETLEYNQNEYNTNPDISGRTKKRPKFRSDRMGYWPELYNGEGRYLPYKITIEDNLPIALYQKLNPLPYNDMGDSNPAGAWYNLTFNGWGYFDDTNTFSALTTGNYDGNTVLSSFSSSDLHSYFDLMRNLEEYADENNVIRLFPIFSNGKDYRSQLSESDLDNILKTDGESMIFKADNGDGEKNRNGGRDALQIDFEYKDERTPGVYFPDTQYFLYTEEEILDPTNLGELPIKYASINNLNINLEDSNITNIYLKGAALQHSEARGSGIGAWNGTWEEVLTIYQRGPQNKSDTQQILEKYGSGLYNLFMFVVSPNAYQKITREGKGFLQHSYSINDLNSGDYYRDRGTALRDYILFHLPEPISNKNLEFVINTPQAISNSADYNESYFVFAIEKVTEAKFVSGLSSRNNGSSINDQVDRLYNIAPSMVKQTHPIYQAKSTVTHTEVDNQGNTIVTNISSTQKVEGLEALDNENIYIIKNVDLTTYKSVEEAAFQIRLFSKYQGDQVHFYPSNLGDQSHPQENITNNYLDDTGNNTLFYDINEDGNVDDNEVFLNASYYFTLFNAHDHDGTSNGRYYEAKSQQYLGLYDFILYACENPVEGISTPIHYHLYAFRHSNVFVKLVDVNCYDDFTIDSDGFVDHQNLKTLWEKRYYIGMNIDGKNEDDGTKQTLEEAISSKVNKDGSTYRIIDYVTGLIFAEYKPSDTDPTNYVFDNRFLFRIRKNYILYIEKVSN